MKSYFLYRHIRNDTNQVFYVGVGTVNSRKNTEKTIYFRAYSTNRTDFWKNITKKTDYTVEILMISDDLNFIYQKEIEFIALYKRIEDGGSLVNFAPGGAVNKGWKVRDKKPRKNPKGSDHFRSKKIYQFDLLGNQIKVCDTIEEMTKHVTLSYMTLQRRAHSESKYCPNSKCYFTFEEDFKPSSLPEAKGRNKPRNIKQIDPQGNVVKVWPTMKDAAEAGFVVPTIYGVLRGHAKTHRGYSWSL